MNTNVQKMRKTKKSGKEGIRTFTVKFHNSEMEILIKCETRDLNN